LSDTKGEVPIFSLGLSNRGLRSADEPRVLEAGREMLVTGNWTITVFNRKDFAVTWHNQRAA
jgi:hypothetical protein